MSIPNSNEIASYLHCGRCVTELMESGGGSPREYQQIEMGWTTRGFQVWCKRHNCNVLHVDFEGVKHPANTTALKAPQ